MPGKRNGIRPETLRFRRRNADIRQPGISPATIHMKTDAPIRRFLAFRPDLLCPAYRRQAMNCSFSPMTRARRCTCRTGKNKTIVRCLDDLGEETGHSANTHSDSLLSGLLECLLDYCMRYYERQFITRGPANEQLMRQYESVHGRLYPGRETENARVSTAEYCSQRLRTIVRILLGYGGARNGQATGDIRRTQAHANSPAKTPDHESARPCDRRGAGISVLAILLLAVQKDHRPDARPLSDVLLTVYAVNISTAAVGPRTAAFVVSRSVHSSGADRSAGLHSRRPLTTRLHPDGPNGSEGSAPSANRAVRSALPLP